MTAARGAGDEPRALLYFAYGSNMDPATLRDRRGIDFRRATAARVSGWRLCVDKPSLLGNGEAVATIVRDPDAALYGVLYEIDDGDAAHLDLTEGVLLGHYARIELEAFPLDREASPSGCCPAIAFAYASPQRDGKLKPSRRYRDLLVAGARFHALPESWVKALEDLPVRSEGPDDEALRPFLDAALRRAR